MTGNPTLDKILLLINGAIVAAATALVIYSHMGIKAPPINEGAEFGSAIESSMDEFQKVPLSMEEIVVNLYSREARLRFLDTKMDIELFKESDRDFVTSLKPIINDALIDIAGNMKPSEVNSVTGRILLETRIKERVNKHARRPVIKKIYFSKFIVQ
ncbi:MAG: hypothetical protein CME62_17680 [Halobacteriovoraceae bacterium]|nr:hypothetical protein [Halobacteriovoraceae bacterium]|tara:strand:- start:5602 stop:6072 length:471 start_codon:yes stop_codon:yes gene_type:complete